NPGPHTNVDGQNVSLALSAHDNDNDTLTYSASGLPTGLSINASTGVISGTLSSTADQSSDYLVVVGASDGTNSVSQEFQWNITKASVPDPAAQTNLEGDTVSLTIHTAGFSGSPTFTASGLPAGLNIHASNGVISGTIAAGAFGSFAVVIAATDGTISANA